MNRAALDLFDPATHAARDLHPVWKWLRANEPLHRQTLPDGRAFASVTRYRDACRVLGDHKAFTSERGSLLHQLGHGDPAAGRLLVSTDPPGHQKLRAPLQRGLGAATIAALEVEIRRAVRAVLSPATEPGEWDVAERAAALPVAVAGTVLGLPRTDWPQLARWTAMAAAPDDPSLRLRTAGATLAVAHHALFDYFAAHRRDRLARTGPARDLVDHLVRPVDGAPPTEDEAIYSCYALLLGANATTPHAVAGMVVALAQRPELFRAAATAIPAFVEEGLRWTSPAASFLRHAVDDVELSGGVVRSGEAVAVWVGSANRDEDVFDRPDRFELTRTPNRHIAFGFGPHYCLGAPLARATLRAFCAEFFATVDHVEQTAPERRLAFRFVAGFTSAPVRTRPRKGLAHVG